MAKKGSKFNQYSYEMKLQVVEDYLSGKYGGYIQVAKMHGLKSHTQVAVWVKQFRENPKLLATDSRGIGATGHPKSIKIENMNVEQQNEYLRMENAILKKLKALLAKYQG